jgi:hypothetical protein
MDARAYRGRLRIRARAPVGTSGHADHRNDPNEWWHGDEGGAIWTRQLEELGSFPVTHYEVEAWEEGTVGWACVKQKITSPGGSFDGRATYVLHLERGDWKVVHVHWSIAKPNVEFLGRDLTTSLGELERVVQREQPERFRDAGPGRHGNDRLH